MNAKVSTLREPFRSIIDAACQRMDADKIAYCVTDGLRTGYQQYQRWLTGRRWIINTMALHEHLTLNFLGERADIETVTNCDGLVYRSAHQDGEAADIVPADEDGNPIWPALTDPRWRVIGSYFVHPNIQRGSLWVDFPDFPHYEYKA